jgi:hypothetical protein
MFLFSWSNIYSIAKELEAWKNKRSDLFKGEAWVRKLKFDKESLTVSFEVDLDYTEEYIPISVMIITNKSFNVIRGEDYKEVNAESVSDCLRKIFVGTY